MTEQHVSALKEIQKELKAVRKAVKKDFMDGLAGDVETAFIAVQLDFASQVIQGARKVLRDGFEPVKCHPSMAEKVAEKAFQYRNERKFAYELSQKAGIESMKRCDEHGELCE